MRSRGGSREAYSHDQRSHDARDDLFPREGTVTQDTAERRRDADNKRHERTEDEVLYRMPRLVLLCAVGRGRRQEEERAKAAVLFPIIISSSFAYGP